MAFWQLTITRGTLAFSFFTHEHPQRKGKCYSETPLPIRYAICAIARGSLLWGFAALTVSSERNVHLLTSFASPHISASFARTQISAALVLLILTRQVTILFHRSSRLLPQHVMRQKLVKSLGLYTYRGWTLSVVWSVSSCAWGNHKASRSFFVILYQVTLIEPVSSWDQSAVSRACHARYVYLLSPFNLIAVLLLNAEGLLPNQIHWPHLSNAPTPSSMQMSLSIGERLPLCSQTSQ